MARIVVLAIATAYALAVVSLGRSSAQPVSPPPGATTTSHPTFAWSLAPGDTPDTVYIANRPDATPQNEFYSESVVMRKTLLERGRTEWTPAEALFAGPHWWNVETRDSDFNSAFSRPSPFTVASELRALPVRINRASYTFIPDELSVTARWVTNVRDVVVEMRILRGRRVVGLVRRRAETFSSLSPDTAYLTWERPRRVRTGTRLTVMVTVRGGGKRASIRRAVRAP